MRHSDFADLRGARNHATAEGAPQPAANQHDMIAAAPLVMLASVVLDALQKVSGESR